MEKKINEINDEEQVARILFSPSHIYELLEITKKYIKREVA